ncbi:MAG: tetratricopeptide repeat protein [Thermoplasmata archaeon]
MERNEIKILESIYESLDKGLRIVLIEGEEGIGKTDLLKKFCDKITNEAICTYSNIKELKENFLPYITNNFVNNVKKKFQSGRLSIIESLGKNVNQNEKFLFFISLVSSITKTVIILDDVEYGPSSLFNMIMYMIKNYRENKIMIIFSYNNIGESSNLKEFLLRIEEIPKEILKRMKLEPFTLNDVITIIGDLNYHLPKYLIEKIYDSSKGNIKKINQILEYFKSNKLIDENNYWVRSFEEIPNFELPSVKSYFYSVYSKLNEKEKRILTACSVIGENFTLDEIKALENLAEEDLYNMLDKFIQLKLIEEKDGVFKFREPEYQNILYENEISNLRKKFLHKKLAEYYEKKNEDPYKIGFNYYKAGEVQKSVKYLEIAGKKAYESYKYKDALDIFLKINEFKEDKSNYLIIGECYFRVGNFKNARVFYEKALKFDRINAILRLSELEYTLGNLKESENLVKEIENSDLNKDQFFYLNYLKGSIAERKFDITTSMNYYKIALGFALELNKYNYMALIYKQLGNAYFYGGEIQNAENMYKKSLEYYDMISDYEGIARVYNNLALLDEADKDLKKTLDYYELSLSYANLSGNIYLLIIINYNIAEINFWNCKIEEAERGIKIAKNLSEMINEVDVRHSIFSFLSDVEKFKGNFIDALDYIERAISYSKKMDSIFYTSFYSLKKFELYSIIGRELDIDEINKDVENLKKINPRIYEPYTFGPLGKMKIYNGEIDEAIESLIKAYSVSPDLVSFVNYVDIVGNIPFAFALKGDFENFKKYVKDLISLSNSLKGNILHINAYIPSLKDGDSFSNSEKFLLENNLKFLLLIMYISYYSFNKDYSIKIKIVELSNEIGIRKDFINKLI